MDVVAVLNQRFDCSRCRSAGAWMRAAKPEVRQESTINRLSCARCGEQIIVKVVGGRGAEPSAVAKARHEYETLLALQASYPQDEHYGVLAPLGFIELPGQAVMITRLFPSVCLARQLGGANASGVQKACHAAGAWLRKLHESAGPAKPGTGLAVADRLAYLEQAYARFLDSDAGSRKALELLKQTAPRVDALPVQRVRLHGDFKPGNLLCDGTRYVGLDIHWQTEGPSVYDLAPFLNHVWTDARTRPGVSARRYELGERAFLSGYGYDGDVRALRWVQLYFALCYLGNYRRRGIVGAIFGSLRLSRLVRGLDARLVDAA